MHTVTVTPDEVKKIGKTEIDLDGFISFGQSKGFVLNAENK
jgi:hypothetical protein